MRNNREEYLTTQKPPMPLWRSGKGILRAAAAVFIISMPVNPVTEGTAAGFLFSHADAIHEISAVQQYYGPFIESIERLEDDFVFHLERGSIYYRDGKMLNKENLQHDDLFSSIFYRYPPGPLEDSFEKPPPIARRSDDFFKMIFGETEREIRKHCREVRFLRRMAFVNTLCIPALKQVEREILKQAGEDPDVADFAGNIRILYSFKRKEIVGSKNSSFHGYGLAVDLVPASYDKKHVYWKWSAVYDSNWHRIPVHQRWSPPQPVIDAFERNGFVWGGKWRHFDVIHFEYRPEIIANGAKTGDAGSKGNGTG